MSDKDLERYIAQQIIAEVEDNPESLDDPEVSNLYYEAKRLLRKA